MKRAFTALGMVLAMSSGCEPVTLDPLQTQAQVRPVPDAPSPTGEGFTALAMRAADVHWPEPGSGLFFNGPFLPEDDPEALVLFINSRPVQCQAPVIEPDTTTTSCLPSAGMWQFSVALPSDIDPIGVIDLTDPRIGVFESMWSRNGICGGGSMSVHGIQGTLEIVSSDAASVAVTLRVGALFGRVPVDGDYIAHRCGEASAGE